MTERSLIRRLKRGDREALRAFYEQTFDPLYRYVYFRAGGRRHVAEDVVQETFLRAIGSLNGFAPRRGSLRAWLFGIARNCLREHGRATEKREAAVRSAPDAAAVGQEEPAELKARVNATLALLPAPYAAVLVMKHVDRRSVRDIAQVRGKSEKAIESLLGRARKAFKKCFPATGPEASGSES